MTSLTLDPREALILQRALEDRVAMHDAALAKIVGSKRPDAADADNHRMLRAETVALLGRLTAEVQA